MSVAPLLDGESLQTRLALAFTAQETGISAHTLYGLVQIQALIANPEKDADQIMHIIAESARDVAHATWIGIAFLERGQLICRAGVGIAARSIHNLAAILPASDHRRHSRGEILRIENAETDSRIEADICRQLEAIGLLMLPIHQGHTFAGVFAVLFAEPHTFTNEEVRTYQLMASLVTEFVSPQVEEKVEYKQPATESTVSHAILRMTSEMGKEARPQFGRVPEPKAETIGASEAPAASVRNSSGWSLLREGLLIKQVFKRSSLNQFYWKLAVVPIVIILITVFGWTAYLHRSSPVSPSAKPNALPAKLQLPEDPRSAKPSKIPRKGKHSGQKPAFKRKRIGQNEVDFVMDDVTIRQFGSISTPKEPRGQNK
jgi:hypothetical protein